MAQSKNVTEVTDSTFEDEVTKSKQPVLVDFWAEWCGPCKALAPTIESVADQFAGQIKVLKMNVDENPEIPTRFSIRGIPTLILFKDGSPVDQLIGNQPKDAIVRAIQNKID